MGEYDALFEEPAKAPARGEYAALFDAPEPRKISYQESAGMGAVHGLTFGAAPAIAGGMSKLAGLLPPSLLARMAKHSTGVDVPEPVIQSFKDRSYGEARDQYRQLEQEAQAANPKMYGAGEIAGAAAMPIPGAGLVKGTGLAAKAARGAISGAAAGGLFGAGEAIGEGAGARETLQRTGEGLAGGALVGGVAAPIVETVASKAGSLLQRKAEKRMVDQAIKDFAGSKETGLSKPTDRQMIARVVDPLREELVQPDAIKIADTARKDPGAAWEMVQKKVDSLTQDRAASYAAVDSSTGGFRIGDLRRHLADEVKRLGEDPGQKTERAAVEAMIEDIDKTWGQKLAPQVPTMKLREYVTRLQRVAADTMGGLEETRRVQILDHVSGLAKDFLDKHLDDAARADASLKPVVEGLRDMNRKVSAWLSVEDALKTRASKLETNRMVDNRPKVLAAGAVAAPYIAHMFSNPYAAIPVAALAAAPYALPPIDRAVIRGLARMTPTATANPAAVARLLQAARAGASRPQLQAQAQQEGVPVELADNIAQQSGR